MILYLKLILYVKSRFVTSCLYCTFESRFNDLTLATTLKSIHSFQARVLMLKSVLDRTPCVGLLTVIKVGLLTDV